MLDGALRETSGGILLDVEVRPGAPRTRITGFQEARHAVRVDVAARPEKGEANRELAAFLVKLAGRGSGVSIVHGATSRRKTVFVTGLTKPELAVALARGMK